MRFDMPRFRILSTGNTIIADEAFVSTKFPNDFELLPEPAPVARQTKLTRLEYLSRFTDAEAIAIDLGSIGATEQAAMLRRMATLVANAEFIDLDDPRTIAGVQALEVMTYLSPGRAAEILA
jgi:hypothetical protein